jgi:PAS domain S-box-containing protein
MNISLRFGLCIGGIIIGYSITVILHSSQANHHEEILRNTSEMMFPAAQLAQSAQNSFKQQAQAYQDAVLFGDTDGLQKAATNAVEMTTTLQQLLALPKFPNASRSRVLQILTAAAKYTHRAQALSTTLLNSESGNIDSTLAKDLDAERTLIAEGITALSQDLSQELHESITMAIQSTITQRTISLWTYIIIVTSMLTLIVIMLSRWVIRLREVMAASIRLSQGDFSSPISSNGNDEVGLLANAFDSMRTAVQQRDHELRSFSDGLEAQVRERTEQLETKNAAFEQQLIEQQRAEVHIRLLDNAISQIPDAVAVLRSQDHSIQYANIALKKLTGNKNNILGQPFHRLFGSIEADIRELIEVVESEGPSSAEMKIKFDKIDIVVDVHATPIRERDGTLSHVVIMLRDVTEIKSLEAQRNQGQKLESIGQLAAGVAHEINTPIQFVGDNLRFLQDSFRDMLPLIDVLHEVKDSVQTLDSDLKVRLEAAEEAADVEYRKGEIPDALTQSLEGIDRVTTIVRALKEFSHPDSDTYESVDLKHAIESTLSVSRNEYKYVADIQTNFDEEMPLVSCLIGKINQVVLNMVVNASHAIESARKDSGERGIITISTKHNDGMAEIHIADTGCGMSEDVKNRVFEPFFTTKEVGKGTGQGLYLAHDIIIKKHHGTIDVFSTPGKGTTFVLKIPVEQNAEDAA